MAAFTLTDSPFPDGTEVGAYNATGYISFPPNGPPGSAVTSAPASERAVTLTGLESATAYFAAALVSGKWRYVRFLTAAPSEPEAWEEAVAGLATKAEVTSKTQPLDSDLTALAALAPADGAVIVRSGGTWVALAKGSTDQNLVVRSDGTLAWIDPPAIYAKAWGVNGTESAEEGKKANEAIAAAGASGAEIKFPAGTILCETTVFNRQNCFLNGQAPGATIFKAAAGLNADVISTYKVGEGGQDNARWANFQVDGNQANNLVSGRGIVVDGRKCRASNIWWHDTRGDGMVYTQSAADIVKEEGGMDFFMDEFLGYHCSGNGLVVDHHDATITRGQLINNTKAQLEVTAAGNTAKLEYVHTWGLCEFGMRVKGSANMLGCECEGASVAQVRCEAGITWIGGSVFTSSSNRNVAGFEITKNSARCIIIGATGKELGTGGFLKFSGEAGGGSRSMILGCTVDGASLEPFTEVFTQEGAGTPSGNIKVENLRMVGNTKAGAAWPVLSVAAAAELVVENTARYTRVTGNTEITSIKATQPGHIITLRFTGTPKVVKGGNLKLASTLEATADDTLTIECDGTNFYEIGRSVN